MKINQITSKTDRVFFWLMRIARIVLVLSLTLLLILIIVLLVFRGQFFTINPYPALGVIIYSLFYSAITILSALIYYSYKRQTIWSLIIQEVLLFVLTSIMMTIFYFVNSYMISNYY